MRLAQVGAQLFTVRDFCQTPADLAKSLRKIRQIGYQVVQISSIGPIDDAELVRMLAGEGLVGCATHEPPIQILERPDEVVAKLRALGCRHTAYPGNPKEIVLETLDDVKRLAARLNAAGKVLRDAGQVLSYHNHHLELKRYGGRLMLEVLFEETDPRYLGATLDTYWVQYGGGDTVDWCRRLAGRLPLLHLKDYMVSKENKHDMAEVGMGNLRWPAIIAAADQSGCEWYIVEQDYCAGDPFDSLRLSFEYIRDNLVSHPAAVA